MKPIITYIGNLNSRRAMAVVAIFGALGCDFANAQNIIQIQSDIQAKVDESAVRLRTALVNSRNVYRNSCNSHRGDDCDMATLGDVKLFLLDMEIKYTRSARSGRSEETKEKNENIRRAASDALQHVIDLADLIKK